jgi:mono/diheme cytochrome c family protein
MKTPRPVRHLLFTLAFASALAAARAEEALPQTVEFNRDIRPILSDTCYKCHGPDKAKRKADLRLDTEAGAKAKLDDGFVIVPGNPAKSELIRRITTSDEDDRMPPADSGRQLTPRQRELLRRWIEQGAKWEAHWSFIEPKRPAVPTIADCGLRIADFPAGVRPEDWSANPIDGFILKKMTESGLVPSREATPEQLIRRMTLDLTGLPPTPAETDAFVAESIRNPQSAIRNLADRLLASPAFGERMASRWLDAARYADTSGYQSDGERSMWRWRDWVIDAFNHNMPFDQFTIEQLAGDLLPPIAGSPGATRAQRIATGFNRNHRGNAEGGIVPEEYAAEYVVDRVDTTATVWLGLTMGCARCHDHKYDPVTQREFYGVFAFFNNVPEHGRAVKIGNSPPVLTAPTDAQERELAKLEKQLADAETRLHELEPQITVAQTEWEKSLATAPAVQWTVTDGLQARFELDGKLTSTATSPPAKFAGGEDLFAPGRGWLAAALDGKRFIDCGDVGDFGFFDKFTLTAWIQPRGNEGGAILSRMVEQAEDSAFASDSEGYSVHLKAGRVQVHLTKRWLDDALRVETEAALAPEQWDHVAVVYDGSRLASGVRIFIDGQPQKTRVLLDQLNQTFQTKQPLRIGAGGGPANRFHGLVGDVRVYGRTLSVEEIGIVATTKSVTELAAIPAAKRTADQAAKLRSCFLAEHAPAPFREAQKNAAALRGQRAKFVEGLPTVMVMEEMAAPRETFVLKRGEYDKRGERVTPGVPASLPPLPADAVRNRLGFARWLVSPENPLTARVAVNYQWQMLFGTGLVKTAEDFGSQGEPPSHPEVLDWLATEFVRTGWDVKQLLKTIVTSATYRQSSARSPVRSSAFRRPAEVGTPNEPPEGGTPNDRDPDNRLLARGPRVRLPAEMIRDQALAVSGLLVHEIGGPSVKPYQPPGLWKELSGTDYVQDHGDALWRRSLYTFWKRTSPQPTMTTFDAAGREMCSVRPSRTDTPLQALALMNDVTFVEAARCLAQRVMREGGATPEERVRLAFRLVLARAPKPPEMRVLLDDLHDHLARFRGDAKAAQSLISAGEAPRDAKLDAAELAAYTAVAGLILNLDEAITKQ